MKQYNYHKTHFASVRGYRQVYVMDLKFVYLAVLLYKCTLQKSVSIQVYVAFSCRNSNLPGQTVPKFTRIYFAVTAIFFTCYSYFVVLFNFLSYNKKNCTTGVIHHTYTTAQVKGSCGSGVCLHLLLPFCLAANQK